MSLQETRSLNGESSFPFRAPGAHCSRAAVVPHQAAVQGAASFCALAYFSHPRVLC